MVILVMLVDWTVIAGELQISEGNAQEDAIKNIREAIELYLEPIEDDFEYNPEARILEIAV